MKKEPKKFCKFNDIDYSDIIGKRFGHLVVLDFAGFKYKSPKAKYRSSFYKCKCDCGNICEKTRNELQTNAVHSCGFECGLKNLSGQRFGRLTVLERDRSKQKKYGDKFYKCKCDCGNIVTVRSKQLKSGNTRSCGCLKMDALMERNCTLNGLSKTRLYSIWSGMMGRCYNPSFRDAYRLYGARGITVCDRWQNFLNFYEDLYDSYWSAVEKYQDEYIVTIDRIDGTKGYYPENCRWVSKKEQNLNLSRNRLVTVYGNTMPLAQAVSMYAVDGLSYSGVLYRLDAGYNIYDALLNPSTRPQKHDIIKPLRFLKPGEDGKKFYEDQGYTN